MNAVRSLFLVLGLLCMAPVSQSATIAADPAELSVTRPQVSTETRDELQKRLPIIDEDVRRHPNDAHAYAARAGLWCHLEKYELAIPDSREAIRLNPQSSDAHCWLGYALLGTGKHELAIPELARAIELGADKSSTYQALAVCRAKLGDHDRALRDLDAAITATDDKGLLVGLIHARGSVHLAKGDTKKAEADFDRIVRMFPNVPAAYQFRGIFYLMQKDCVKAIADLEQALRLDDPQSPRYPRYPTLVSLLGADNLPIDQATRPNLAQYMCDKTDWKHWLALAIYADWLFEVGRYDDGMKWSSKSIELAPDDMKEQLRTRQRDRERRSPFRAPGSDDGRIRPN